MTMPAPDITQNGVPSLLQYCVLHVVKRLDFEPKPDLSGLELELGLQIWKQWTKYGQPQNIRLPLQFQPRISILEHFQLCSERLVHLDLYDTKLTGLAWLKGVARLQCLCMKKCLLMESSECIHLRVLKQLKALDLEDLESIDFAPSEVCKLVAQHIAGLPSLQVLNVTGCWFGDGLLEALTYGQRKAAWAEGQGKSMGFDEQQAWPPLSITQLHLKSTLVTQAGLAYLTALPRLQFLDVRSTTIQQSALLPLQHHFRLSHAVHRGILTSSNALAAAAVNGQVIACACNTSETPLSSVTVTLAD